MVIWPFLLLDFLFPVSCVMIDRLIALWRILIWNNFHCSVYSHLILTEEFLCSVFQILWFCSVPSTTPIIIPFVLKTSIKKQSCWHTRAGFVLVILYQIPSSWRIRVERMFSALVLEEWVLNLVCYFVIISIFYCIAVFYNIYASYIT